MNRIAWMGLSVSLVGAAGAGAARAQEQPPAEPVAEAVPEVPPAPDSFWEGWEGSVAVGASGSSGNTERLSFRLGVEGKRIVETMETKAGIVYALGTEDSETTENKFRFDIRNDWLIKDSRWRYFAQGTAEYDDFQAWDWRLSGAGGVGYEFIENDRTLLIGRVGLGASKEIGGDNEDVVPELVLGADFEHKLTERQKVFATIDFYPALDDLGPYRFVGKAGWEILVDPEVNLTLKLGIEDRYDSTPGEGFKRNDLDYFALLAWNF